MKILEDLKIIPNDINLYETAFTHTSYANENNVASYERLEYLGDAVLELVMSEYLYLKTNNDELIAQGVLGLYNNAKVKMTNNAYNDGTDDYIIVKTSKAFAYCNGIDKLKPYEPEKGFAEAVKGLNTYGGKMVRPKECAVLRCHQK